MKKIATLVLAVVLLFNISAPVFASDVSSEDHVHEIAASAETVTEYIPRNSKPQSTESTVAFIQPYAVSKCGECGTATKVVKKAIWETASCGHYAYWDGSVCKNNSCGMPYLDRVYTTCSCW